MLDFLGAKTMTCPDIFSDPAFFFSKLTQEDRNKINNQVTFSNLQILVVEWMRQRNSKKSTNEVVTLIDRKTEKKVNTTALRIDKYEDYYLDVSVPTKVEENIDKTAKLGDERKPGLILVPHHPGTGKTRTVEQIIMEVMNGKLIFRFKEFNVTISNDYLEKLKDSFGLYITCNDVMESQIFESSTTFCDKHSLEQQLKADLLSRILFMLVN